MPEIFFCADIQIFWGLNSYRKENIDVNVCGVKAKGFTFEYIANDADIEQIGNIVSFKLGKILYIIQFTARKEDEQKAQNVFDKLIVSMTINEH